MRYALIVATAVLVGVFIAGCLEVPLGDPERSAVSPAMNGFYDAAPAGPDGGDGRLVFLTPYDRRTYLMFYYNYSVGDGGAIGVVSAPLVFKAWLTDVGGVRFITAETKDPGWITGPDRDKRFVVARVDGAGSRLTVRPLNTEFASAAKDSAALERLIAANLENPRLYEDASTYVRTASDDPRVRQITGAAGRQVAAAAEPDIGL